MFLSKNDINEIKNKWDRMRQEFIRKNDILMTVHLEIAGFTLRNLLVLLGDPFSLSDFRAI